MAKHWQLWLSTALLACSGVQAGVLSLQGDLNAGDPNDVLLIPFTMAADGEVAIQTWGYGGTLAAPGGVNAAGVFVAGGGFDPYVSLFQGTGPGATFLASNDDGLCPPGSAAPLCADSTLVMPGLAAGSYTLALTLPFNYSFAENLGTGTLGDGFIGLDSSFDDGSCAGGCSAHYAIDILTPTAPVPEPSAWGLMSLGLVLLSQRRAWRRTACRDS